MQKYSFWDKNNIYLELCVKDNFQFAGKPGKLALLRILNNPFFPVVTADISPAFFVFLKTTPVNQQNAVKNY